MKKIVKNKNVVAPEQKVKSATECITDYLVEIGFSSYGLSGEHQVLRKSIAVEIDNNLYAFVKDACIRIYQGIRTGMKISAKLLHTCTIGELEETIVLLAEKNYI
ncbi:MAG: hypothetical protein P4L51_01750 [Puia sp.]|nr:hypothetical protein [Puia sp.]